MTRILLKAETPPVIDDPPALQVESQLSLWQETTLSLKREDCVLCRARPSHVLRARRRLLSRIASFPASVLGPVESPPCIRHRPFLGAGSPANQTAGALQGVPLRVLAPHLGRSRLGGRAGTRSR